MDKMIHYPRNEVLGFRIGLRGRGIEELLEILVAILEIVGGKAPYVHADRSVVGDAHPLALLVFVRHLAVFLAFDFGALHATGKMLVLVLGANATRHCAILAQRVGHAEAHHGIGVLAVLGQIGKELADNLETVAVIEIVTVDDTERLVNGLFCHHHGMVGSPRLGAAFGYGVALGKLVEALENELAGDFSLVLGEYFFAEILFEILADYPNNLAETSLNRIIDAVVHDGLAVGTQTVQLLQATVTATHTSCQK